MNLYSKILKIAIITDRIGKKSTQLRDSFIFDEVFYLTQKKLNIHVIRSRTENSSFFHNITFHGIKKRFNFKAFVFMVQNLTLNLPISFLRNPKITYKENLYALTTKEVIKNISADIIHAHFAYPEGLVGLLAKKKTKKPLVITVHGYDILTELSVGYGARLNKKLNFLIKKTLKNADAVITASHATYDEVNKIIENKQKIHLIPNGVDIKKFNPSIDSSTIKKRLQLENNFIIFTLRNHEPVYGLKYLIKAFKIIKQTKKNVILIIGGDGSLRNHLEKLAKQLEVDKDIIFTGKISRDEVLQYYSVCDVVVVPSLQEAFGLVISEAMACEKPVIGSNVGGIPDQIINGFNGFLVKPKDPDQIADQILYLINNPKERKNMGINGRKIVLEKFTINKRITHLISLYNQLL